MAGDTRTVKIVITGDSSSAKQALESVSHEAEKSHEHLTKFKEFLETWATRGVIALGAVGTAAGVMGLKAANESQQAQIAFTTMLGSGEKAEAFMKRLKDFAAKTPFDFPELVKSAQMMQAMGINAKDVIPTLTAVGDAIAGMGGSQDQIEFVTRALGQMSAKGKVAGDEILQLTEQGIPALKILADQFHVTPAKMQEMITKGKVLSDKAIPAIVKGLEQGTKHVKGFGGMMELQSHTMSGVWSNFMDTLTEGLGGLVEKVLPNLTAGVGNAGDVLTGFFDGIDKKGLPTTTTLTGKADLLGRGIGALAHSFSTGEHSASGMVGQFEQAGLVMRTIWHWIQTTGIPLFTQLMGLLGQGIKIVAQLVMWFNRHRTVAMVLGGAILFLVAAVKAHNLALAIQSGALKKHILEMGVVKAATAAWSAVQWLLNAAMSANPMVLVTLLVIGLISAVVLAYKHCETFRKIVDGAWSAIKTAFRVGVGFVINYFLTMVGAILHGAAKAFGWIPGIGGKLKTAAAAFDKFHKDVNNSLAKINDQTVNVGVTFSSRSWSNGGMGGHRLATGGPVRGPGTGTSDSIPTWLSNGEHVLTADEVNAAGGHGAVMRWRKALKRAGGGPILSSHFPSMSSVTSSEHKSVSAAAQAAAKSLLSSLGNIGGSGVSRWAGLVLQVLGMLGQPAGLLGGVLRRIGLESGGNPFAINRWDINARLGHPSQGLMQTIPGTFNAYAGPFRGLGILNPLANVYAGLNYALHRYGSIGAIDPLVRPYGYDSGGLLKPGLTLAYNGTGKPEAVFTGDQMRGMGGPTVEVKINVEGSVIAERDLIKAITLGVRDELLRHAHRNGGRTGLPGK